MKKIPKKEEKKLDIFLLFSFFFIISLFYAISSLSYCRTRIVPFLWKANMKCSYVASVYLKQSFFVILKKRFVLPVQKTSLPGKHIIISIMCLNALWHISITFPVFYVTIIIRGKCFNYILLSPIYLTRESDSTCCCGFGGRVVSVFSMCMCYMLCVAGMGGCMCTQGTRFISRVINLGRTHEIR